MREKGLGLILRELAGDRQAGSSTNENAMDVDEFTVVPKTTTLVPGPALQLKRTVNLACPFLRRTFNVEQEVQAP